MLVNVLRDEQPTHVAVAFDLSRKTFRLAEYPEYKAKRNKTPTEFSSQLPLIERVLDTFSIPHITAEGYEADDIIATLVTQALADETAEMEVLILTGDRDSIQLVTDRSTVLYPMRGVSDLARMTPTVRRDKYGVPPQRYPELAAIVGETSDNLPGVRVSARATPPSGSTPTTASTTSSPTPTRSPARRARRCASTSAT